jgi:hypothetical protein
MQQLLSFYVFDADIACQRYGGPLAFDRPPAVFLAEADSDQSSPPKSASRSKAVEVRGCSILERAQPISFIELVSD